MEKERFDYSEIINLAGKMKFVTSEIEDILASLKDEDYIRIGESGDIWTGDASEVAHQTFEELLAKFPDFSKIVFHYADETVEKVTNKE